MVVAFSFMDESPKNLRIPPLSDVIQDCPAAIDWRLTVAFVVAGIVALYWI